MVHVSTLFDVNLLKRNIEEGYVRVQKHPALPLFIYNYSEKAQYDKRWNTVTLACRGLILDEGMNIVARPWNKFFNYGEGRLRIDDTMPVEVTDKMDGSLGILYWDDAGPGIGPYLSIATRGSFASEQAIHGSRVFNWKYAGKINYDVTHEYTFLFEIIYPENRIVLNYEGMDDLVLLGAVHIERGYYLGPQEAAGILSWDGPITRVFPYRNIAEAFAADPRPNAEGFVVRSGTEIVKIKQVDYIELHRIVTNLTPLNLWKRLSSGETLESLAEYIPDEWHEWLRTEYAKLMDEYAEVEGRVWLNWGKVRMEMEKEVNASNFPSSLILADRKIWARNITKNEDRKYLFLMLDKKPIADLIWQEIRPGGSDAD